MPVNRSIEVVTLPVADVDRSLAFYTSGLGFALDVDYHPSDDFRVVQLTPPGSSCSIQIGVGLTSAEPGSARGTYLVVPDLEATRLEFSERGVEVGPIRHKFPRDDWRGGWQLGLDPERRDYASLAELSDPDGNTWILQERG
jgi:catechol 2,3-dioxygenase-like lactoylglutathione lyase family enzyme